MIERNTGRHLRPVESRSCIAGYARRWAMTLVDGRWHTPEMAVRPRPRLHKRGTGSRPRKFLLHTGNSPAFQGFVASGFPFLGRLYFQLLPAGAVRTRGR